MKKVILLLAATACIWGMYRVSPYHQPERQTVQLIQPQVMDIRDMVLLQGRITDAAPIRLYAHGASTVTSVLVKPGQRVKAGQLLMELTQTEAAYDPQAAAATVMAQLRKALEEGDIERAEGLAESLLDAPNTLEGQVMNTKAYGLYSPVDCTVMEVLTAAGETISGLLPCLVLCDARNLHIEAQAAEDMVGLLQEEMDCEITVPAFQSQLLRGKVEAIMPYARQTGNFFTGADSAKTTLHISVDETKALKPGYRAEVRIIIAYKNAAVLVPYEAVCQDESGQEYVLLLEHNTICRRDIQTGSELDECVEVLEGVSAEDILLASPEDIQEGVVVHYDAAGSDGAGAA